jgi:hypothetical protein
MKRALLIIYRFLPFWLLLSSCGPAGASPQTWIDTPLDQTTAPLGPISILAHASASEGVARMEFYVNGQHLEPSVIPVRDSGVSLFHAEKEFTPTGPGIYKIEVLAIDSAGNNGVPASSKVLILDETASNSGLDDECPPDCPIQPEEALPDELPPAELPIETEPTAVARMDANCREGPSTVYEIYGNLLKGEQAPIKGRNPDTSWLLVALPGRSNACWIAISTVDIQGSMDGVTIAAAPPPPQEPPPAETEPPVEMINPEPIEVDNEPPVFYQIGAEPSSILANGVSCSGYENTTMVYAVIVEDSGLSLVAAHWSIGSASGVAPMSEGWLGYYTSIGPINTAGSMSVYFTAVDNYGNIGASDTIYVTVYDNCIK